MNGWQVGAAGASEHLRQRRLARLYRGLLNADVRCLRMYEGRASQL